MSIDPLNSELQKLQYLKTFRLELDGLVQSYRDNQSLIAVLRNALEESPSSSASSLQGRVSVIDRMSKDSRSLGAVHSDVKTMLLSRIEALESSAPKKALQNVRVAEDSLLKDFPNEIVSRAFELIPQEERTLRVRKTLIELFEKSNNQEACSAAVQSLEPTLRARILTNALSFYQKKRDFEPLKYFLSFIRTGTDPVPEELIKIVGFLPIESFRGALSNLLEISDRNDRAEILITVTSAPEKRRVEVIENLHFLFSRQKSQETPNRILTVFNHVPVDLLPDIIEKTASLIRETLDGGKCYRILLALGNIPADQRADVIEKATPLIRETSDGAKCYLILLALGNIPAEQRADVIEKATPLIRESQNGEKCYRILEALNKIPADQRADVIEKAIPLIRETSDGVKCALILITLGRIPANQRADVIEKATPLIRETPDGVKCSRILDALANIPENLRSLAFETISPLIQDSEDGYRKAILIGLFSLLPEDQRTSFISELHTFKTGSLMQMNLKELSSLTLLPPEHRLSILQLLNRSPDLLREDILHNLFISDPALKQACLAYLVQEIETVISSPTHARLLSKAVVASEESLGLHEEHPLFQKAIEILCLTDPQTQNDNKNPYRMYSNLVDFAQTEPLINIPLPTQEVSGIQVGIDLDGFRASSLQGRFTREDLPDGIRPDAFNTLFSNLETRLTSTAGLSEEIERSYEYSLQKLKENIVHGAVISGLLQLPTNPNEPIREASFYLYTILQAILRTSPERKINELLSDQERALLSFAHATIACRTGQLDGIALYYNALPLELRIKTGTALTPSQERLRNVIDTFIQSTLNDTFANRQFLQLVGGQEALSQESHQTFYLKNRLFKHVGLRHSVTFDLNTGVLSNALLQASSIHLLERFFGCCAPETLTKTFQKEIESSLRNPASGLLKPLDDFFDLQVSEGRGDKETWIFYNEESDGIELTELGALSLLEHFGKVRTNHVN